MIRMLATLIAAVFAFSALPAFAQSTVEKAEKKTEAGAKKAKKKAKKTAKKADRKAQREMGRAEGRAEQKKADSKYRESGSEPGSDPDLFPGLLQSSRLRVALFRSPTPFCSLPSARFAMPLACSERLPVTSPTFWRALPAMSFR